ncbi:hypothetical protein HYH03_013159 [Edaphochlamys debaryana]|uniref:Uncharacterized protein n=1 Tax=Edaphochlamys debaryana TaxID=47281 RepID=A0A835XRA8_9CHLO|nr:hypothetical protein HYH03_013159 [Edaphochlamys debaryana]|eukprot:KAG2488309.1 hypothetical protein HYH03_013159 [Edaphochlamys debaryana]
MAPPDLQGSELESGEDFDQAQLENSLSGMLAFLADRSNTPPLAPRFTASSADRIAAAAGLLPPSSREPMAPSPRAAAANGGPEAHRNGPQPHTTRSLEGGAEASSEPSHRPTGHPAWPQPTAGADPHGAFHGPAAHANGANGSANGASAGAAPGGATRERPSGSASSAAPSDNGSHATTGGSPGPFGGGEGHAAAPAPAAPFAGGAGAGFVESARLAAELGARLTEACRSSVRDMLREALLEVLPLPEAAEVLFKIDSHSAWIDITAAATATAAAAAAAALGGDAAAAAIGAILPGGRGGSPPPPPSRESASLPATPSKAPPPASILPPPPLDTAAGGAAASSLAPLTPARSAPVGTVPLPSPAGSPPTTATGHDPAATIPTAAATTAPTHINADGGEAPSHSPLLLGLMQQHPHLVDVLQRNPHLLASILALSPVGSAAGGAATIPPETLAALAAALPAADGAGSIGSGAVGADRRVGGASGASPFEEIRPDGAAGMYGNLGGGAASRFGGILSGLSPSVDRPLSGARSPPSLASPAGHGGTGPGLWGSLPTHGSPGGPFAGGPAAGTSPSGGGGGLEAFHALMGLPPSAAAAAAAAAAAEGCRSFDELSPSVRDKIQSVLDTCGPHIRAEHFDAGVRHWLLQLQLLFGELCAVSALHAIETAANLEGVRRMKAFITTRLIDHYEQMVWAQDPQGYALRKLTPDLIAVLDELVSSDKGLRWTHFDPKVLDTIREIRLPEAVRTRLSKLCAQELSGVQNVPAYLYTLLSKRGKTAKQAAAQKQMQELALRLVATGPGSGAAGGALMMSGDAGGGGMGGLGGMGSGVGGMGGLGGMGGMGMGMGGMGMGGLGGLSPLGSPAGPGAGAAGGMYGGGGAYRVQHGSPYGGNMHGGGGHPQYGGSGALWLPGYGGM